jgi:uncharacterized protein (TIGR02145 family)
MRKLVYTFTILVLTYSCKKAATINNVYAITCKDNPNINFKSIGTPVGKFTDCIKDIDGNTYKTVTIGTQTWMAENLKTTKYNDGTSIPNIKDSSLWNKLNTGAWCYFENDSSSVSKCCGIMSNDKYGKLYNWYTLNAVSNGNKNVCPLGWHVPNIDEWSILIDFLGGENVAGGKMKEIGNSSWVNQNNYDLSTNLSLLTLLPGGVRNFQPDGFMSGDFAEGFTYAGYLSSSEFSSEESFGLRLSYISNDVNRTKFQKKSGNSIRCIKD